MPIVFMTNLVGRHIPWNAKSTPHLPPQKSTRKSWGLGHLFFLSDLFVQSARPSTVLPSGLNVSISCFHSCGRPPSGEWPAHGHDTRCHQLRLERLVWLAVCKHLWAKYKEQGQWHGHKWYCQMFCTRFDLMFWSRVALGEVFRRSIYPRFSQTAGLIRLDWTLWPISLWLMIPWWIGSDCVLKKPVC